MSSARFRGIADDCELAVWEDGSVTIIDADNDVILLSHDTAIYFAERILDKLRPGVCNCGPPGWTTDQSDCVSSSPTWDETATETRLATLTAHVNLLDKDLVSAVRRIQALEGWHRRVVTPVN